jgi:hypothetical protein
MKNLQENKKIEHFYWGRKHRPPSAIDLAREAEDCAQKGVVVETFYIKDLLGGYLGEILWIPSICRGGIAFGSDAVWSDASDVEDLITRICVTDDINN